MAGEIFLVSIRVLCYNKRAIKKHQSGTFVFEDWVNVGSDSKYILTPDLSNNFYIKVVVTDSTGKVAESQTIYVRVRTVVN